MNTGRATHHERVGRLVRVRKCSALSFYFVLLLVVAMPLHLPAQERLYLGDRDCVEKTAVLPGNPQLTVHFTADANVPLSEPPIRECRFGVEVTDRGGKSVGRWGPVLLSAPPVREILKVHNRDIILIGALQYYLLAADAGVVKELASWQAEKLDYFRVHDGDLRIVVHTASERYAELPDVFLFDGQAVVPDEAGRKAVLEQIVKESASELESADKHLPADWPHGLGAMMRLRKACVRALRAEAVLGDAATALQLCEKARKGIYAVTAASCPSNAPNCVDGFRDTEISLIDDAFNKVKDTEPYRRTSKPPPVAN